MNFDGKINALKPPPAHHPPCCPLSSLTTEGGSGRDRNSEASGSSLVTFLTGAETPQTRGNWPGLPGCRVGSGSRDLLWTLLLEDTEPARRAGGPVPGESQAGPGLLGFPEA